MKPAYLGNFPVEKRIEFVTATRDNIVELVFQLVQRDILTDAGSRFKLEDIHTFADLHNYVDGNEYLFYINEMMGTSDAKGNFTQDFIELDHREPDLYQRLVDAEVSLGNAVMERVNAWLRTVHADNDLYVEATVRYVVRRDIFPPNMLHQDVYRAAVERVKEGIGCVIDNDREDLTAEMRLVSLVSVGAVGQVE
jgi:hypothetical protein